MLVCWRVDARPGSRGSSDMASTFINIYGSKELFVNEYRVLLSDRLVEALTYDTEKEVCARMAACACHGRQTRHVEMLKAVFGEDSMHGCDVMLRDVAESRRINTRVHEARVALYANNPSTSRSCWRRRGASRAGRCR